MQNMHHRYLYVSPHLAPVLQIVDTLPGILFIFWGDLIIKPVFDKIHETKIIDENK